MNRSRWVKYDCNIAGEVPGSPRRVAGLFARAERNELDMRLYRAGKYMNTTDSGLVMNWKWAR